MNHARAITALGLAALLLTLAGACHRVPPPEPGASQLSEQGMRAFERQRWPQAVDAFQKVKDRYPFSPYALTAEMKIADALYMQENYAEAITAYQEFERMHPRNEQVPYAVFMQGMSNYQQMLTKDRDQNPTAEALRNFQRLTADYPTCPLVPETKGKIGECQERLAAQELYVARWYNRTGHARSARARLTYLLANYPQTQVAAEAKRFLPEVERRAAEEEAKGESGPDLAPGPAPLQGGVQQRPPIP